MTQVFIGVDPHKLSATIEVVDQHEKLLGSGRFTSLCANGRPAPLEERRRRPVAAVQGADSASFGCAGKSHNKAEGPGGPGLRTLPGSPSATRGARSRARWGVADTIGPGLLAALRCSGVVVDADVAASFDAVGLGGVFSVEPKVAGQVLGVDPSRGHGVAERGLEDLVR